jgi:vanillate O-demethylase ferredoxin subunit
MKLRVIERKGAGSNVCKFVLQAVCPETLKPFKPGDHLELTFDAGPAGAMVRQYSLTNFHAGETSPDRYEIGIQNEKNGRGGSAWLHKNLVVGSLIEMSAVRSNFPLDDAAEHVILIAGGIGVTPILSMARARIASGQSYELHFFSRDENSAPLIDEVRMLTNGSVKMHSGKEPDEVESLLRGILAEPRSGSTVHICGPVGLLDAIWDVVHDRGWTDSQVRFERFAPEKRKTDRPFVARLPIGKQIQVAADESLLEALRREGIGIASSCNAGTCGTCLIAVTGGGVDHRDSVLSSEERAENVLMCPCVSRALGAEISIEV